MRRASPHIAKCIAGLVLLILLPGCGSSSSDIAASKAWVRFTGPSGAAYVKVQNSTSDADALTGASVSSDVAGKVTLHATNDNAGMTSMKDASKIDVPAKFTLEMKPGAFHFMLDDLRAVPAVGAKLPITLTFEHRAPITVQAEVR